MNGGVRGAAAAALVGLSLAACGDDPVGPSDDSPEGVAAQSAALVGLVGALGVSSGNMVGGVPCVLRGYMVRRFDELASAIDIQVVGCELTSGIRLDGSGRIRIPGGFPIQEMADISSLSFNGAIEVASSEWTRSLTIFEFESITAGSVGEVPAVSDVESVRLTVEGEEWRVAGRDIFDRPEDTRDRDLTSLGSATLLTLDELDAQRIAVDFGAQMGSFILNELTETLRGQHSHTSECGTVLVTPEGTVTTGASFDWSACRLAGGMVVAGKFEIRAIPPFDNRLRWTLTGPIRLGGAVPEVVLSGLTWTVAFPSQGPEVQVDGDLMSTDGSRSVNLIGYWAL